MLRITTWNVNSVRLREASLRRIAAEIAPDVLCLQEVKVEDAKFPRGLFDELGYRCRFLNGQKAYHGVAILAKRPLKAPVALKWCAKDDCRHAIVELAGGIELHNFYIPAGGDVPDPGANPKFRHKLDMLADLADWFENRRDEGKKIVLVGDLNVAPLPSDVWSHKQLLNVVSHTPVEVEALNRLQASHGFVDAVRAIHPPERKLFTWWSYRNQDWTLSDRGRRLDHVWLSPALAPALRGATVHREARGWDKPSDHVPVTVELKI